MGHVFGSVYNFDFLGSSGFVGVLVEGEMTPLRSSDDHNLDAIRLSMIHETEVDVEFDDASGAIERAQTLASPGMKRNMALHAYRVLACEKIDHGSTAYTTATLEDPSGATVRVVASGTLAFYVLDVSRSTGEWLMDVVFDGSYVLNRARLNRYTSASMAKATAAPPAAPAKSKSAPKAKAANKAKAAPKAKAKPAAKRKPSPKKPAKKPVAKKTVKSTPTKKVAAKKKASKPAAKKAAKKSAPKKTVKQGAKNAKPTPKTKVSPKRKKK